MAQMVWSPEVGWLRFDGRCWRSIGPISVTMTPAAGCPRIAFAGVIIPAGPMPSWGDNDGDVGGAA